MKLDEIKEAIEKLTDAEKKVFFAEVIPEICDKTLSKEGCLIIFEKNLSDSRYLASLEELYAIQNPA